MPNQQKNYKDKFSLGKQIIFFASSGLAPKQKRTYFFGHHIQHSDMKLFVMGRTEKLNVIFRKMNINVYCMQTRSV